MRRRNVDVLATYTHELAGWLTLRDRFSYNHSNLDYSCVEKSVTVPVMNLYMTGITKIVEPEI